MFRHEHFTMRDQGVHGEPLPAAVLGDEVRVRASAALRANHVAAPYVHAAPVAHVPQREEALKAAR